MNSFRTGRLQELTNLLIYGSLLAISGKPL